MTRREMAGRRILPASSSRAGPLRSNTGPSPRPALCVSLMTLAKSAVAQLAPSKCPMSSFHRALNISDSETRCPKAILRVRPPLVGGAPAADDGQDHDAHGPDRAEAGNCTPTDRLPNLANASGCCRRPSAMLLGMGMDRRAWPRIRMLGCCDPFWGFGALTACKLAPTQIGSDSWASSKSRVAHIWSPSSTPNPLVKVAIIFSLYGLPPAPSTGGDWAATTASRPP